MLGSFGLLRSDEVNEQNPTTGISITAPSGNVYQLTPEEERAFAKRALEERMVYRMTRTTEVQKAIIGALGLAIGAFLASLALGKLKVKR